MSSEARPAGKTPFSTRSRPTTRTMSSRRSSSATGWKSAEPSSDGSYLSGWNARRVTVDDVELELFEHALDEDTRLIEAALDTIERANAVAEAERLAAEVERFAMALRVDAIVPMDF